MIRRFPAVVAVALTIGLFVVGGRPGAGESFPGLLHWIAHLLSYAVIAAAYTLGLPRLGFLPVALLVAGIGVAHEYYEIEAHAHALEWDDILVNALGALAGALAAKLFFSLRCSPISKAITR